MSGANTAASLIQTSAINGYSPGASLFNANTWTQLQTFSGGTSTMSETDSGTLTV